MNSINLQVGELYNIQYFSWMDISKGVMLLTVGKEYIKVLYKGKISWITNPETTFSLITPWYKVFEKATML